MQISSVVEIHSAFFEEDPPEGQLLSPVSLQGSQLAISLLSLAYPLAKAALKVRDLIAQDRKRRSPKVMPAAVAHDVRVRCCKCFGSHTPYPVLYTALVVAYVLASWGTGAVAIAALGGWKCATFRTCSDPGCSLSGRPLPFGLVERGLPFTVPPARSTSELILSAIDPTGAQLGLFQWQRTATLTQVS